MEAGHQLALALGQVKGGTVGLGEGGDDEDHHAQGLEHRSPHGDEAKEQLTLELVDLVEIDRAVDHQQADDRQAHGDLVADYLGGGAQGPEHSVFVGRGPAGEDDAVDREADKGEEPENAEVKRDTLHDIALATQHQGIGEGHHGKGDHGGKEDDQRGQHEIEFVLDMTGSDILLEDQLDRVGEILHQPGGAEAEDVGAIWAGAILEEAGAAPLHPHADGDEAQGDEGAEGDSHDDHEDIKR